MALSRKHPATKETVGAQYICFNVPDEDTGEWTTTFESTVYVFPTVTQVSTEEASEGYDVWASGASYESDSVVSAVDISETNVAFDDEILEKMKGNVVEDGVVLSGKTTVRPWFAYGIPVIKHDGSMDLRWYPKCKLTENTDATATSTDSHSDQTDDMTIRAYSFDEDGNKCVKAFTANNAMKNMTQDAFFAAPLLTVAAVKAAVPSSGG